MAITRVVALPWAVQGVSTVGLLVTGPLVVALVLAALAALTVAVTVAVAVPAHGRLAGDAGAEGRVAGDAGAAGRAAGDAGAEGRAADLRSLLRANLARTIAWTLSTGLTAGMLLFREPGAFR